jgi:hypothetical protein
MPAPRLLAELGHLGPRDRLLLGLLADHQVLTTGQVHALLFGSLRRAQRRLAALHRAGFLSRSATGKDAAAPNPGAGRSDRSAWP